MHPLDAPVRASLLGAHSHLAQRAGRALRYPADVSPFAALPDGPGAAGWSDLAALAAPGEVVVLPGVSAAVPPGWEHVEAVAGVQLVDAGLRAAPDPDAVRLGAADVPEMLGLVARTRPGPFLPRTIVLGTYLGLREDGRLVAMAGERLHPPGWTEISAVCTDPARRGRGLATRLLRAVAAGVRERGETPFLHTAAANTAAVALYEHLGFRLRRTVPFLAARRPGVARAG